MDELRRSELMEIYKDPSHKGKLTDPSIFLDKQHIFCGDQLHLDLDIKNGIIKNAKFDGQMCFVSLVSADLLLEEIIGQTIEQARLIDQKKLLSIIDLNLSTSRIACATLVLKALHEALDGYESNQN
jgi:nitrogen fixation NifU-like protein